jgi:hypothetical protein
MISLPNFLSPHFRLYCFSAIDSMLGVNSLDEQLLFGKDTPGFCLDLSWSRRSSTHLIPLCPRNLCLLFQLAGVEMRSKCANALPLLSPCAWVLLLFFIPQFVSEFPFIFFLFSINHLDMQFLPVFPLLLGNSLDCLPFLCICSRNKALPSLLCLLARYGVHN